MKMIIIGGSSGSHEPLKTILRDLPEDIQAAVLVLRHSWPATPSVLGTVLRPGSALPVDDIEDGMTIRLGTAYVAPSGMNVTFEARGDGHVFRLTPCTAQMRGRPNIDVSLISAAAVFEENCIGVILSGYLDDGTLGAIEVGEHDGVIIAQSPSDAEQSSMPLNVIQRDSPDYILPDIQIAGTLQALARGLVPGEAPVSATS